MLLLRVEGVSKSCRSWRAPPYKTTEPLESHVQLTNAEAKNWFRSKTGASSHKVTDCAFAVDFEAVENR